MSLKVDIRRLKLGKRELLHDVSFSPSEASLTAVIGKNGSGKTTLLRAVAGLISYEGSVLLDGIEVSGTDRITLSRRLSILPQELLRPHISVERLVSYGRNPYRKVFDGFTEADIDAINGAVQLAELGGLRNSYLDRISGGELRRAYFAMMLAQDTGTLLLDEATAFMDADFERRFVKMQKELSKSKTVITVMHNLNLAVAYADKILLLDSGRSVFYGTPSELLEGDLIERTFSVERYTAGDAVFFA